MAVARSKNELEETGVEYTVADLGTAEGCALAVSETQKRLGPIEIFVCNHGIGSAHEKVIWEQDVPAWDYTMRVNGMVEQRYGRCVYIASTAADIAEYAGAAYNSSKRGLLGLMHSVSQDAGAFNVTSNAVLPGWVKTAMADRSARAEAEERGISAEEVWAERASLYAPGRVATPREVAEMITFFASEESSGVSGQAVKVALGGSS
jgi:NAD(P)-dependent dehydrogenase (short-subunit alcohol dehydrogenase family)